MRKIFLFALALSCAALSNAQTFKPFKVDLATGYAIPGGEGSKGGVLFAVEPKYAVNDNITVGLRMEGALTARASVDANGELKEGDVKASASYLLTGDYFFSTNKFRPFAGAGAGLYKLAGVEVTSTTTGDVESGSKFGFAPRAGFEFGHFRMAAEYNVIGKTGEIKNSYMGIKLGFFIGGGRLN